MAPADDRGEGRHGARGWLDVLVQPGLQRARRDAGEPGGGVDAEALLAQRLLDLLGPAVATEPGRCPALLTGKALGHGGLAQHGSSLYMIS
jgi:hypothetical protein